MVSFVQPMLADAVLNGSALLAVSLVSYLSWLHFHEKRAQRRVRRERERERRSHWGYM
jgi:hypothetical protein